MIIKPRELQEILNGEGELVDRLKRELAEHGDGLTDDAERKIRIGYRVKGQVELRLERHRWKLDPVTGEPIQAGLCVS